MTRMKYPTESGACTTAELLQAAKDPTIKERGGGPEGLPFFAREARTNMPYALPAGSGCAKCGRTSAPYWILSLSPGRKVAKMWCVDQLQRQVGGRWSITRGCGRHFLAPKPGWPVVDSQGGLVYEGRDEPIRVWILP